MFGPTLGADVRVVELPNTTHVTSEGDGTLVVGARLRARDHPRLRARAGPAGVARHELHVADPARAHRRRLPRRLADAAAATLVSGPDPGLERRRAVTVAAGALADAPVRYWFSGAVGAPGCAAGASRPRGIRSCACACAASSSSADAAVDGTGSWRFSDGATRGTLAVELPSDDVVHVRLSWDQRSRLARARVGRATLTLPAP